VVGRKDEIAGRERDSDLMRIKYAEKYVLETIKQFVEKHYPEWKKKLPKVKVQDTSQFVRDIGAWYDGYYDTWDNAIVFNGEPQAYALAHELAHWAQAMRLGREEYRKLLHDRNKYEEFEYKAVIQADKNEEEISEILHRKKPPKLRDILKKKS